MDRRRRLMNEYEAAAEAALGEAAARFGARVLSKVRLADALNLSRSGLSDEEFAYATRAHLDLVVVDNDTLAQFAVEFDGPQHDTDPEVIAHDLMKDGVCERLGLLVIRVDCGFLRRVGRFRLVEWLAEVWFMGEAFQAAQERGEIDPMEPFLYFSVMEPSPDGQWSFAYALDMQARVACERRFDAGKAAQPVPEEITSPWDSPSPYAEAWSLLPLPDGTFAVGHARVREFRPFSGVSAHVLAQDLAVADLGQRLQEIDAGKAAPVGIDWVRNLRRRTSGWRHEGMPIKDA